jgi:hypothetical protein
MQRHTTHGHVSRMTLILAAMAIVGLLLAGDGADARQLAKVEAESRPRLAPGAQW